MNIPVRKLLLSAAVALSYGLYSWHQRHEESAALTLLPTIPTPTASATPGSTSTPSVSPSDTPAATPTPTPAGHYRDGQYTGGSADAYYGFIQVKAIVSGGRLTDVQFLSYPNDRSTSRAINQQATPMLRQEAIQAQSAQVDIISGATDTSQAFIESLGSALTKAQG